MGASRDEIERLTQKLAEWKNFMDLLSPLGDVTKCAVLELANTYNKYKFHVLENNPHDLPKEAGRRVRVALKNVNDGTIRMTDAFLGYGDGYWYTSDTDYFAREKGDTDNRLHPAYKVVAWREIEYFVDDGRTYDLSYFFGVGAVMVQLFGGFGNPDQEGDK